MFRFSVKKHFFIKWIGLVFVALAASLTSLAQSSSQEFPTPILSSELSGTIKARDIGDARLTTYYFAFNGEQGDVFINLVTRNLTGDFDVFTSNGLKPLTKIVVYADLAENETGRVIYLRKPERLLLRIQGRTPNDDAASFRLKFAGSFAALRPEDVPAAPELPKVENQGVARVNSVGTLLPPPPKPVETVAEKAKTDVVDDYPGGIPSPVKDEKTDVSGEENPRAKLVVTDPLATTAKSAPPRRTSTNPRRSAGRRTTPAKPKQEEPVAAKEQPETDKPIEKKVEEKPTDANAVVEEKTLASDKPATDTSSAAEEKSATDKKVAAEKAAGPGFRTLTGRKRPTSTKKTEPEPKPDPLASINLVIQFKDGNLIEKPMSEVFKFSVDKGVLTVALKDGSTTRYKIIDVEKVTIQ